MSLPDNAPPEVSISVSIVIPIGPGDEAWRHLLGDLHSLPFPAEILCVATTERIANDAVPARASWLVTNPGRALQMNAGARQARGRFVWFLHADSRVTVAAIRALHEQLLRWPAALHYFNLTFAHDGPGLMWLNTLGVWIRSHLLGLPFGDQGLCLPRDLFHSLGGYSESAAYGEDHLLVWSVRQRGTRLSCTGEAIVTSARKYRDRGWGRTTGRHVWLTLKQAWPQFGLWLRGR